MVQKCQILTQIRKVFLIFSFFFPFFMYPFPIFHHSLIFLHSKKRPFLNQGKGRFSSRPAVPFTDGGFPCANDALKLQGGRITAAEANIIFAVHCCTFDRTVSLGRLSDKILHGQILLRRNPLVLVQRSAGIVPAGFPGAE